jgi:hypothetical protein
LACRRGSISLLVEQQRAAARLLELADAARGRAGERTLLVAEQLGFEQVLRDRRAVDRDEAALGAPAVAMDVARHHLLAGAALAGDHHARLGRRDLARHREHLVHRRVLEDELAPVVADRGEDRRDQLGVGRQRQELARAGLDRGDRAAGVGAHPVGDHRHADPLGGERADQPGDVARDVDQHELGAAPVAELLERRLGRGDVAQRGAPLDRHRDRGRDLLAVGADDQHTHGACSLSDRSPLRPVVVDWRLITRRS